MQRGVERELLGQFAGQHARSLSIAGARQSQGGKNPGTLAIGKAQGRSSLLPGLRAMLDRIALLPETLTPAGTANGGISRQAVITVTDIVLPSSYHVALFAIPGAGA